MSTQNRGIFYGWFIMIACFFAGSALAEVWAFFGVFFKSFQSEFGWSRSVTSSASVFIVIGYSLGAITTGRLTDKYHPRLILLPAAALAGIGLGLASQVNSLGQLYFALFLAGFGGGPTNTVPVATVQRWFRSRKHAGTALAVTVSGAGLGQLVFTPLLSRLIPTFGWRDTLLGAAIGFFALATIASLFVRRAPHESRDPGDKAKRHASAEGWAAGKAVRTLPFIGLVAAFAVGNVTGLALSVHIIPYATDIGLSATAAAAALGLMGGLSTPSRLASGFVASKLGWHKVLVLSYLGKAAALIWFLLLKQDWMIYGFVAFNAAFVGLGQVSQMGILSDYFGLRSVGTLIGIINAVGTAFGAAAPYIAGFVFDKTDSYFLFFGTMTLLMLAAGVLVMMLKKPRQVTGVVPEAAILEHAPKT